MANFLKHFRGPRKQQAARGNKGQADAPQESCSSSVAPLRVHNTTAHSLGSLNNDHSSSKLSGVAGKYHNQSNRSIRSWGRRRKRGEDDQKPAPIPPLRLAPPSPPLSGSLRPGVPLPAEATDAGARSPDATTTAATAATPPLTPESQEVSLPAKVVQPSTAAGSSTAPFSSTGDGGYTPYVPEETSPAVKRALAGESLGTGRSSNDDKNGKNGEEQDEDDWNAIANAVKALDRAGNELFAKGDYEAAFLRYERALILKRSTLLRDEGSGQQPLAAAPPGDSAAASAGAGAGAAVNPPASTSAPRADIVASVATSINNLTYLQQRAGVLSADESLASYFKSLQMKREIYGPTHLSVGKTLNNIGSVFYLKKEYQPALQAYQDARRIMEGALGSEHGDVGTVLSNIGDVYFALERHHEALDHYRTALRIRWVALGPSDPKVARLMHRIAALETGKQPVKEDGDASDSESEEYQDEDRKRSALFREDVLTLQEEIMEDMKFFDLLEREMAINMLKDKMRIFREIRELYNDSDGGDQTSSVNAEAAVPALPSEAPEIRTDGSPATEPKLTRARSISDGAIDLNTSFDSSNVPSPAWKTARVQGGGLSTEDRQKALTSVQSRLAKLREERACVSESSGDDLRAMAVAVDPSPREDSPRRSYMFPTASSVAKASAPVRRFLPVMSPEKRQLREEIRQRRLQASAPRNLLPSFNSAVAGVDTVSAGQPHSLATETPPLPVSSQPA